MGGIYTSQVGDFLKDARIRKGLSIDDVAQGTGIRTQYLEALENGEYSKIPGDVFIKGFIRNYGNFLAVDGNALVEEYKNQSSNISGKKAETNISKRVKEVFADNTKDKRMNKKSDSFWGRIKRVIYDNIYETVEIDDEEDKAQSIAASAKKKIQSQSLTHTADEDATSKNFFFNGKVFFRVFVVCLVLFIGFMSYFLLSNIKTFPKSTNIFTALKNAVSTELSTDKEIKAKIPAKSSGAVKEAVKSKDKTASDVVEDKKDEVITGANYTGNGVVVEITYKEPVWTQVSIDGKGVEADTVAKGVTKTYKANKEVKVNLGSIRDVEIKVNGKVVPYGEKEWGTVEKTFKR